MRQFFLFRLSACERDIMDILWSSGRGMSANDVLELWDGDDKPSYNTIATHLTRLSHKNFVEHRKRSGEKTFYYSPVINRAKYHQRLALSMCLLVLVCLTVAAAVVVSLPVFRTWHTPHPTPPTPHPTPIIHQPSPPTPQPSPITRQPSLPAEFEGGDEGIHRQSLLPLPFIKLLH